MVHQQVFAGLATKQKQSEKMEPGLCPHLSHREPVKISHHHHLNLVPMC